MKFAQFCIAIQSVVVGLCLLGSSAIAAEERIELSPVGENSSITIRSRDARQQLIVTSIAADGSVKDATRDAAWVVSDPKVLVIDSTGMAIPTADGNITVTATVGDKTTTANVAVSGFATPLPINFRNQVVPIFTKLGCNGGGCHGKSGGQNGFKLSLLGFYPEDDFEFLRKESRGRRIFPAIPGESLLLMKAVGRSPHGGGKRMENGSYEYNLLVQWIEQGMPYGTDSDPFVTGIHCVPETRTMSQKSQQQIAVIATYSDGTTEDVTRMALFHWVPIRQTCRSQSIWLTRRCLENSSSSAFPLPNFAMMRRFCVECHWILRVRFRQAKKYRRSWLILLLTSEIV